MELTNRVSAWSEFQQPELTLEASNSSETPISYLDKKLILLHTEKIKLAPPIHSGLGYYVDIPKMYISHDFLCILDAIHSQIKLLLPPNSEIKPLFRQVPNFGCVFRPFVGPDFTIHNSFVRPVLPSEYNFALRLVSVVNREPGTYSLKFEVVQMVGDYMAADSFITDNLFTDTPVVGM